MPFDSGVRNIAAVAEGRAPGASLRRYWIAVAGTIGFFTVVFVVVEALGLDPLTNPRSVMDRGGWVAGVAGVALLTGDALLPVPSSVVMVLHGALYGVVAGAALSLAGRVGAAALGFAVGRRGGPALEQYAGSDAHRRADHLLQRWGVVGIVVSRPVPLVAETTMVLAGASAMSWSVAMTAAVAGSLPEVLVYALAGSVAAGFGRTAVIFLSLLGVAALAWFVAGRRYDRAGSNGMERSPRM